MATQLIQQLEETIIEESSSTLSKSSSNASSGTDQSDIEDEL